MPTRVTRYNYARLPLTPTQWAKHTYPPCLLHAAAMPPCWTLYLAKAKTAPANATLWAKKAAKGESKKESKKAAKASKDDGAKKPAAMSKKTLETHAKWQAEAERLGGPSAKIVVSKADAKKLVFDALHDSFKPMNINGL